MADPLKLLQEYTAGERELRELTHKGKLYYVFGDTAYAHDTATNIQVYNKDEYYTLESIFQLWKNHELQHNVYVKNVSGKGIQPVTRMQRKELMDFLQGKRSFLSSDASVLAPIATPVPVSRLLTADEDREPERKRPKMVPPLESQRGVAESSSASSATATMSEKTEVTEVRGLSSELPAEKIAQLRSRVKNNLIKNTNRAAPEDESGLLLGGEGLVGDSGSEVIASYLKAKERVGKTRITCLEAQNKDFGNVLVMLSSIKTREANAQKQRQVASQQPQASAARQPESGAQNGGRSRLSAGYSRYDQEIFQKDPITEFNVITDKSFHGGRSWEQQNEPSIVQAQQSAARRPPPPQSSAPRAMPGIHPQISQQVAGQKQPAKRVSRTPIIIVPGTETSLITMYNAIDILQDLKFIPTEEKKKTCRRENEALLQRRKPDGSTVPYRVIDNPLRLRDDEWERVVAVFVQGAAWQFKGWKWNGNPVEIFSNVAAFHIRYEDQKVDANVAKWNVNILQISKTKRHLDKAHLHKIWDVLDRFIAKNKPQLRA